MQWAHVHMISPGLALHSAAVKLTVRVKTEEANHVTFISDTQNSQSEAGFFSHPPAQL